MIILVDENMQKKISTQFTTTGFIVHANNLTVFFGDSIQEYNLLF